MNFQILRRDALGGSVLVLDPETRERMRALGNKAETILRQQDTELWADASEPHFLENIVGGAIVLQRLGSPSLREVFVEDLGAHMAFLCCVALSLFARQLSPNELSTLKSALEITSLCCAVKVEIAALPPLASLPASIRTNPLIHREYERFRAVVGKPGGADLPMAEALALRQIFLAAKRPEDSAALAELNKLTAGLRAALQRVREVAKPTSGQDETTGV